MLKTEILKGAFASIYYSGAARFLAPAWGGIGAILCLHHVVPGGGLQSGFAPNSNLEITPEFLTALIRHVRARGYEILSLDQAIRRMCCDRSRKRFIVFTLDDGYKDNFAHAMPVFLREECPFTVYVAPGIADATCSLWWRTLEAIIAAADGLQVEFDGRLQVYETDTLQAKWATWKALLPQFQTMPEFEQRKLIDTVATRHGVDPLAQCREAAMTWGQIRQMADHPLATIGAHTLSHYNLKKLNAADAFREILESGKRIAEEIARPITHFAFPYGNKDAAGPREFLMAQEAGYASAAVTRLGTLEPAHATHIHALPRIMISGRYQDLRYIDALLSGVPSRLANGFSALNVS